MSGEGIRLEHDGPVAVVTIDNGDLNLFSGDMFATIERMAGEIAASGARAMVYTAAGEVFSGGADVHGFDGRSGAEMTAAFGAFVRAVRAIEALPLPTLAVVRGLCLTAGLEVALGCDLIWASEDARFGLVEAVVGLTPGAGGTQRMAQRAGPGRAREFVMTGGLYEATKLEQWGVVNRVLPAEELHEKAMRFAQRLAAGPTRAHAATKQVVRAYLEGGIDAADAAMPALAAGLFETEDLRQGVRSFLEQGPGKASFEGR